MVIGCKIQTSILILSNDRMNEHVFFLYKVGEKEMSLYLLFSNLCQILQQKNNKILYLTFVCRKPL